jgi:hypothetical protein
MSKEAMTKAIEVLKKCHYYMIDAGLPNQSMLIDVFTAYKALEAAMAEQPAQQEPVAWMNPNGGMLTANYIENFASGLDKEIHSIPLYTTPPAPSQEPDPDELTIAYMSGVYEGKKRKPWVGLTVTEQNELCRELGASRHQVRAIGAKLKEKNT